MTETKKQSLIAIKKAKTSLNNIVKMLENDVYCIDILQQILAVNGLLKSASNSILRHHLHTCFSDGMRTKDQKTKEKLVQEVVNIFNLGGRNK